MKTRGYSNGVRCLTLVMLVVFSGGPITMADESQRESVQWIAHRACWDGVVENATAGIVAAGRAGAAAVEVDVQQARDGTLWLLHDPRVDRTTNGAGQLAQLNHGTLQNLRLLDKEDNALPYGVPMLSEALQACSAYPGMTLYLERKTGRARDIVNAIETVGYWPQLVLTAVSRSWLREVHELRPDWRLGFVLTGPPLTATLGEAREINVRVLCVPAGGLQQHHIAEARAAGLQVLVWFRQEPDDVRLQRVLALGVNGVFVKNPEQRKP